MMAGIQRILAQIFLPLSILILPTSGKSRELVLNYEDPRSIALILAVVPKAEALPHWIGEKVASDAQPQLGIFALGKETVPGIVENSTLYLYSQTSTGGLTKKLIGMPRLELDMRGGQTVEIQPTSESLSELPVCEPSLVDQPRCRISDLSSQILAAAVRHSKDNSKGFVELLDEKKLIMDDWSTKRVLVTLDDQQVFQHADFVGLVRGEDEELSAPDSASVFVVRLENDGVFSIIERRQDRKLDLDAVRFSFEEKQ